MLVISHHARIQNFLYDFQSVITLSPPQLITDFFKTKVDPHYEANNKANTTSLFQFIQLILNLGFLVWLDCFPAPDKPLVAAN